ncbi:MAG: D-alanyl-D-alanine carboxypeptidase family protein [Oscillospiraceae bacterium]|jgi:D-alanyl-D-alanine dipeptidase|nr:D-alanyl-D-alanine carboxypeptidase family protein [Oscillospiraceae bacterium]
MANINYICKNRIVPTLEQRLSVSLGENGEAMVRADRFDPCILMRPYGKDMAPYTGQLIYVRAGVARRLAAANRQLKPCGLTLLVNYGYRRPEIQQQYFDQSLARVKAERPGSSESEAERLADHYAAHPQAAGHVTGGAVDLTIARRGVPLDMGAQVDDIAAAGELIQTFSPRITPAQQKNRLLLLRVMTNAGFMPFFHEYWHFEYGDREWAFLSGRPCSLYSPVQFRSAG